MFQLDTNNNEYYILGVFNINLCSKELFIFKKKSTENATFFQVIPITNKNFAYFWWKHLIEHFKMYFLQQFNNNYSYTSKQAQ